MGKIGRGEWNAREERDSRTLYFASSGPDDVAHSNGALSVPMLLLPQGMCFGNAWSVFLVILVDRRPEETLGGKTIGVV